MAVLSETTSVGVEVEPGNPWSLPSGSPVQRHGLCSLAQPVLSQPQRTPRFLFHDATVILVASGRLDLDDGIDKLSVNASPSLLLIQPGTSSDLLKTPGGPESRFRSIFLTLSGTLLQVFRRNHELHVSANARLGAFQQLSVDSDMAAAFGWVLKSVQQEDLSDDRLRYRLIDFLLALAEHGFFYRDSNQDAITRKLRTLIGEAPGRKWTAREAGRSLAMSEATLRRRLASEQVRFEDLLIDVRMHHAMMLLQTTSLKIPLVGQACGYLSSARFSERFRARFGYMPSAVR